MYYVSTLNFISVRSEALVRETDDIYIKTIRMEIGK